MKYEYKITMDGQRRTAFIEVRLDHSTGLSYGYFEDLELAEISSRVWGKTGDEALSALLEGLRVHDPVATFERVVRRPPVRKVAGVV